MQTGLFDDDEYGDLTPPEPAAPRKPSKWLEDMFSGAVKWEDAPEGVRSAARIFIYRRASWVLDAKTVTERKKRMSQQSRHVRPMVEAEALRLWKFRKG